MNDLSEFSALGLSPKALDAIRAKGFELPSPIQQLTIPVLLDRDNHRDLIAQAQTGTGKTAAFGLPLVERLQPKAGTVQALILVPTRELALQVTEELLSLNTYSRLSIAPIYGGASMNEQLRRLKKGIDVVVGTPGRILDHLKRGTLDLHALQYLVLDEADEMLNMGFIEDVEAILAASNDQRRILLFSATMPQRIVDLSRRYMQDAQLLKVPAQEMTTELTDQIYFEVRESDKFDALTRIVDVEPDFYGIVFCRTKVGVDELVSRLIERGYAAEGLHGDVSQAQREKILRKFKKKQVTILVATDVAARGIDVQNLTHVINYSLPQDTESYVHRIGRTGRAGKTGTAITFISSAEYRQFGALQRQIGTSIKKEALPSVQDVIETKKMKIREELAEIVENGTYSEYLDVAREMLTGKEPEIALASLLRLAFKNELEESHYPEIRSINVDRRGTARLFLSIGRIDGYDARKLVRLLKRECGLTDSKIDDVRLMECYSFVTVPFAEARTVIDQLNRIRHGGRPLAGLAKSEAPGPSNKEALPGQLPVGQSGRPSHQRETGEHPRSATNGQAEKAQRRQTPSRRSGQSAGGSFRRASQPRGNDTWREDFEQLMANATGRWGGKEGAERTPRSQKRTRKG